MEEGRGHVLKKQQANTIYLHFPVPLTVITPRIDFVLYYITHNTNDNSNTISKNRTSIKNIPVFYLIDFFSMLYKLFLYPMQQIVSGIMFLTCSSVSPVFFVSKTTCKLHSISLNFVGILIVFRTQCVDVHIISDFGIHYFLGF